MIAPGGSISLDGERWVSPGPAFLLPVRVPAKLSGGCCCLEPEEPGRLALRPAGEPQQNAFAESLIGRLRDECLNETLITSLRQARVVLRRGSTTIIVTLRLFAQATHGHVLEHPLAQRAAGL